MLAIKFYATIIMGPLIMALNWVTRKVVIQSYYYYESARLCGSWARAAQHGPGGSEEWRAAEQLAAWHQCE